MEYGLKYTGLGGSELDELETVEAHRVVEQVRHGCLLLEFTRGNPTFCAKLTHDVS
jgi:hypothetical protein